MTLAGLLYLGAALVSVPVVARQRWVRPSRQDMAKVAGAVVIGGAVAPVLLLTGRPQDAWLATWSQAEAVVPHPIDPLVLARSAAALLRPRVAVTSA